MCDGWCCYVVLCCILLVRYASPSGSMCFKCLIYNLSGPVVVVFSLFYCLLDLCCGECYCSVCVLLSMCLILLCVLCMTMFVHCTLNVFAICVCEINVFSFKVFVLVFCWLSRVLCS